MPYPHCPACGEPLGEGHTHVDMMTGKKIRIAPVESIPTEQGYANEQVRRLREEETCPTCGADYR